MENANRWIRRLLGLVKGTLFLLFGLLFLCFAGLIGIWSFPSKPFFSQVTARVTSVDYESTRECPINTVVFRTRDGRSIETYMSAEHSCPDAQNPQVGDAVQIVYPVFLDPRFFAMFKVRLLSLDGLASLEGVIGMGWLAVWGLGFIFKGMSPLLDLLYLLRDRGKRYGILQSDDVFGIQ